MNLNPEIFSEIGYLSVILWGVAAVLCLLYWKKPSLLLCLVVLGMTIGGFVCARINSKNYVNLIQLDRSEEIAKREAMEQARQQMLLNSRGDEVAKVNFAEDNAGDFIDRAGMDEVDLKYFESLGLDEPAWKKKKKQRSGAGADDDSIESAIGGKKVISGVNASDFEEEEGGEPVMMTEVDMLMANRLDFLNLRVTLIMLIIGVFLVLLDYLRRANVYGKSSFPLPLPSSWINALTPMPPILLVKKRDQKSVRKELVRLVKRGDSFLYLTDDSERAKGLPESMSRFPLFGGQEHLIPVTEEVENEFIFESIWYGRSSFVVNSDIRAQNLIRYFLEQLTLRENSRAQVTQNSHIVWDLCTSMPDEIKQEIEKLALATGFSVLLIGESVPAKSVTETKHQANPQEEPLTS